jgi:AraC-like DNA-binding protein
MGRRREASDDALAFVQRCQVAVGISVLNDYATHLTALWECMASFPRPPCLQEDCAVAAMAVSRVATRFFDVESDRPAPGSDDRPARRHVNDILRMVQLQHGRPDVRLGGSAAHLGLSASYASRILANETQHSFPEHVSGIRVLAAVRLLALDTLQVKNVAHLSGYSGTGAMDRQFKKWFGLSPLEFREVLRVTGGRSRASAPGRDEKLRAIDAIPGLR